PDFCRRMKTRISAAAYRTYTPSWGGIATALGKLGMPLYDVPGLRTRVDAWLQYLAPPLARVGQRELADIIAVTIERWDPEDTSRRLELWMGRDLQFVRINETVVGGLVGLVIHTLVFVLGG